MTARTLARVAGVLYLVTFVTSIPALALKRPYLQTGAGVDSLRWAAALESASGEVRSLDLVDPPPPPTEPLEPPYALVVHSGPDEETLELVAFAHELSCAERVSPRLAIVAPSRPERLPADVAWVDVFPATGLFAGAKRIVAAAGFNLVRQTDPFRDRRVLVPFPRRYDDPFARAARARRATRPG